MHVVPAVIRRWILLATDGISAWFTVMPEPGILGLVALWFFAAISIPFDIGLGPEETSAFLPNILGDDEWADVHPHTIIQIGVPTDGLFGQWFPSY